MVYVYVCVGRLIGGGSGPTAVATFLCSADPPYRHNVCGGRVHRRPWRRHRVLKNGYPIGRFFIFFALFCTLPNVKLILLGYISILILNWTIDISSERVYCQVKHSITTTSLKNWKVSHETSNEP